MTRFTYYANPSSPAVRQAMTDGQLGCIATPLQGQRPDPGWSWIADNGCFSNKWTASRWQTMLADYAHLSAACRFAVVPDVVGDHAATLALWNEWAPTVEAYGYRRAFVLQDGVTADTVPWSDVDAVFIGGSTPFKLSEATRAIAVHARDRGVHVHCGRVNGLNRLCYVARFCDSADGTFIAHGPDKNLPRMLRWIRIARQRAAQERLT